MDAACLDLTVPGVAAGAQGRPDRADGEPAPLRLSLAWRCSETSLPRWKDREQELDRVTEQAFEQLFFPRGGRGIFIPADAQKWLVQEMRLASHANAGTDGSQTPPVP